MNEQTLFAEALERTDPQERAAFLDQACQGEPALRQRIERLLAQHEHAGSFLEPPQQAPVATIDEPVTEHPGTVIGPYKLLQQIGEGGMGTVFMAEQAHPVQRKVGLKIIKPGMDSKQVIGRFEAERQALALMDHPNIAKVFEAGTTDSGRPFFVMELVKGMPITKYCDEHRLTPKQRLELFLPVCHAIQHAHQKGIIHRDLKPSNVLVAEYDDKPVAKVIDFGVAKATGPKLTEQTMFTEFGQIVGTLEYMSPEQAKLNALDVDSRSDIYVLGVLLYELLTGTTPLDRRRLHQAAFDEMLRIIREEEPPKPSTRLSTTEQLPSIAANRSLEPKKLSGLVRGELDWIVMKCLEKDRNRRYETANGLARDIERYLHDEPVQACPPSAWYKFRKFARRNKGPVLAACLLLLALLVGIIGTSAGLVWALWERDEKARALQAETKARNAEKQARDQAMAALQAMTDDIVENQMARSTTLTQENKEFLRKILKHFEGFAAITADDAASRAIRAEGHHRVGMMRHRLGELKEAEAAYADALAIQKQLAADFPTRPEFRLDLASSQNHLGILLRDTGRLKEAEMAFTDALAIQKQLTADFPTRPQFRQDLAGSHNNLGNLLLDTGRLKEAETAHAHALAIRKQLAADFPTQPEFRRDLAGSHHQLGLLLQNTGRLKEAEAAYADALAIQKQLAADFPTRPEYRQNLATSHNNLGRLLHNTDRPKEAEAAYAEALAIQKQLAADFPTQPKFRQELAQSHNNLGARLSATGRLKEAAAAYADALDVRKQLAADFPARPDFRQDLAWSHNNLGTLLQDTGRLKEAAAAYADALSIYQQLAADFPNQPDRRNDVAGTLVNLGILCSKRRDFLTAKAYHEEALPHHQAALQADPRNPMYRQFFRNNLWALVQAHAGLQDQTAALQTAQKLRDLGWDPPGNAYDAACALAYSIPIVEKLEPEARARAAVQFYGDEAMKMLRDAVAKGWKNAAHMAKDSDLDPLRSREDFKKLMAELEAKTKEPGISNQESDKKPMPN